MSVQSTSNAAHFSNIEKLIADAWWEFCPTSDDSIKENDIAKSYLDAVERIRIAKDPFESNVRTHLVFAAINLAAASKAFLDQSSNTYDDLNDEYKTIEQAKVFCWDLEKEPFDGMVERVMDATKTILLYAIRSHQDHPDDGCAVQ